MGEAFHPRNLRMSAYTSLAIAVMMAFFTYTSIYRAETWTTDDFLVPGDSISWRELPAEMSASRFIIELDFEAESEFDVWLFNTSEVPEVTGIQRAALGPASWLRHAVAGRDEIRWTVDADDTDRSGLTLLTDTLGWGTVHASGQAENVSFRQRVVSVMPVLTSLALWGFIACVVVAGLYGWRYHKVKDRPVDVPKAPVQQGLPPPYGPMPPGPP